MLKNGVSQAALAEKLGLTRGGVNHWFRTESVTFSRIPEIAAALGTTWWYLLTGDESQTEPPDMRLIGNPPHTLYMGPPKTDAEIESEFGYMSGMASDEINAQILESSQDGATEEVGFMEIYSRLLPSQKAEIHALARKLDMNNKLTLATLLRTYKTET